MQKSRKNMMKTGRNEKYSTSVTDHKTMFERCFHPVDEHPKEGCVRCKKRRDDTANVKTKEKLSSCIKFRILSFLGARIMNTSAEAMLTYLDNNNTIQLY